MLTNVLWQSAVYPSLQIEEWSGEFTVFQPDSGKTHFMNQMSRSVILNLYKFPATEEEICKILAEQFQQPLDQNFSLQIIKTLRRFDELGLIEKVRLKPLA